MNLRKGFSHQFKSKCQISNFLMKKFKYLDLPQYFFIVLCSTIYCNAEMFFFMFYVWLSSHYVNGVLCKMLLRVAVYCYFLFVCSTWQMQFTQQIKQVRIFKSKCQISNFLMKKFKYLDLPQYLFINMISYCCKQKFYIDFLLSIWQEIYLKQMWLTVIGWNCYFWLIIV
jgi:hypothetical protein